MTTLRRLRTLVSCSSPGWCSVCCWRASGRSPTRPPPPRRRRLSPPAWPTSICLKIPARQPSPRWGESSERARHHQPPTWPAGGPTAPPSWRGLCSTRGCRPAGPRGSGHGSCGGRPSCLGRWPAPATRTPPATLWSLRGERREHLRERSAKYSPVCSDLTTQHSLEIPLPNLATPPVKTRDSRPRPLSKCIWDLTFHIVSAWGLGAVKLISVSVMLDNITATTTITAKWYLYSKIPYSGRFNGVKLEINEMHFHRLTNSLLHTIHLMTKSFQCNSF